MTNKFEIINDKWIVKIENSGSNIYEISIRIASISEMAIHFGKQDTYIRMYGNDKAGGSFSIDYASTEKKQFEQDVKVLKALIYK